MAKKGSWSTDHTIEHMRPVGVEDNSDYGFELFRIYRETFFGIKKLFRSGATGACVSSDAPLSTSEIAGVINSGMFSLPEDHKNRKIPIISGSQWVRAEFFPIMGSYRHYRQIRLQGDFLELLEGDENEGTGAIAVALMHNLALAGYVPCSHEPSFALHRVTLAAMAEDEKHEENWIGIEIDLYAYSHTETQIAIPMDMKGLIDLPRLKGVVDSRTEEP